MTEPVLDDADDPASEQSPLPAPVVTEHPQVDGVLAKFEGLAERPLAEHVETFTEAHEELRRALDDRGGVPHALRPQG